MFRGGLCSLDCEPLLLCFVLTKLRRVPRLAFLCRYLTYLALFTAARVVARAWDGLSARTPEFVLRTVLFGGSLLSGNMLAMWFVPVLAAVQVTWTALLLLVRPYCCLSTPTLHGRAWSRCRVPMMLLPWLLLVGAVAAVPSLSPPLPRSAPVPFAADAVLPSLIWFGGAQLMRVLLPHGLPMQLPAQLVASWAVASGGFIVAVMNTPVHPWRALALDLRVGRTGVHPWTEAVALSLVLGLAAAGSALARTLSCCGHMDAASPRQDTHQEAAVCHRAVQAVSTAALTILFTHVAVLRSPLLSFGLPAPVHVVLAIVLPTFLHHFVSARFPGIGRVMCGQPHPTTSGSLV